MKRSTRDSSTTATSKTLKYINTTRKREEILEKTQQRLTNHFSTNPLTDATSCKKCIQTQQNSTFDDSQCNSSDINTLRKNPRQTQKIASQQTRHALHVLKMLLFWCTCTTPPERGFKRSTKVDKNHTKIEYSEM